MYIFANPGAEALEPEQVSSILRAAGEETRLRILALLGGGELAVGELAHALNQSQPRISRHLRLLYETGLVSRRPEGAWVFYKLASRPAAKGSLVAAILAGIARDSAIIRADGARLEHLRAQRAAEASAYFARNAAEWERVQAQYLPDHDIDAAILDAAGIGPFERHVDIGVGQGRMLALFADRARQLEGFDLSAQMLSMARAALQHVGSQRLTLQLGDVYDPPIAPESGDLVTMHHVLHFLPDPAEAVACAARLVKPGGRLVIVDFAPHHLEAVREDYAHRWLGFEDGAVTDWAQRAGLLPRPSRILAPSKAARGALTVQIWTADRATQSGKQP
jgi:ArsR family transcriptional regulator